MRPNLAFNLVGNLVMALQAENILGRVEWGMTQTALGFKTGVGCKSF
jgi:hypothetical protein